MKSLSLSLAAGLLVATGSAAAQTARDQISIVGSSTVYPFATVVAERFGQTTDFKTPKIESTGSGGGMKLFCSGVGVEHPDITNSSRQIKKSEFDQCQENGVTDILEVLIGYDGIALANATSAPLMELTRRDIYLALGKSVPNPDGSESFVDNPYNTWSEINPALPNTAIEVMGPPPTSGTRDAFAELALEGGCDTFDWIAALKKSDKDQHKAVCHTVREDGAYIEAGENDNLIVQKLETNPNALGIFGYSFLEQNEEKVQGSIIDGFEPTFESIADGEYPVSRPLYFYVKMAHEGIIPGIAEYLAEFTLESTWGEDGYLADRGMIPLGDEERAEMADSISNRVPLSM
jgi:phosphate transport system substrate-binding protein